MTPRAQAEAAQRRASDPGVSAFVSASAGSGKTKLLTDRVLRLLLAGAPPERIQCLTYTRAAAAEMALRLQRRLAEWVIAPAPKLDDALRALAMTPDAALRDRARALFAQVLDQPGGMRIGTIHAFCQSLLRRFPLEAAVSPHFALIEDQDAADLLREAHEAVLRDADMETIATIAALCDLDRFARHVAALEGARGRAVAADLAAGQRRVLGVVARSEAEIMDAAVNWQGERDLRAAAQIVAARASAAVAARAQRLLDWLRLDQAARVAAWQDWRGLFFNKDGKPAAAKNLVNDKLAAAEPDLLPRYLEEVARIGDVDDRVAAFHVARRSAALVALAQPAIDHYRARKESSSQLDYADLIDRAARLMHEPGVAWVQYKLDGGLEHLLLDEVQDTAPLQWELAHALTDEFFAGQGARETAIPRTVFAVGDRKQSIFSFQGADADSFDAQQARLARRVQDAGAGWAPVSLAVSFRSTAPVLSLVDAVFADPDAAAGVAPPGGRLAHIPDRVGHAGSVELWPLAPRPDAIPAPPWQVATDNASRTSAPERLAQALAGWIAQRVGTERLPGGAGGRGRVLQAGDVMVLLRARDRGGFAASLMRGLKKLGVPVAGPDRMTLAEQPAVADLLALCDALLLPQDDLTFAGMLRSPLGDLSEDELFDLAHDRRGALWQALRARHAERPAWTAAWQRFEALLRRVDYATPHALLTEALGQGGGRARLLRRLGPEAGEPVDELLAAALRYQSTHPPSLQGFVHWLRRSDIEAKREPTGNPQDGDAGMVRIMTVHGAKGLQAPLVILPDTTQQKRQQETIFWTRDGTLDIPLFAPLKELRCKAIEDIAREVQRRETEEENRLLYVALTRAEDRLVICGWQPHGTLAPDAWYSAVARGMDRLAAAGQVEAAPFTDWPGTLRRHAVPHTAREAAKEAAKETGAGQGAMPAAPAALPAWLGQAPDWRAAALPAEPAAPGRLTPSRPQDATLGPVPQAASPLAARATAGDRFRRGQLIHTLLQHLPALPQDRRAAAAAAHLAREPDAADIVAETLAILDHPALGPLFGPGSRAEVPLTGLIGGQIIGGLVDRLAVLPDRVLLADYKTSRDPPPDAAATPALYLRQLAAYRALLRAIHPDRPVQCALIWTRVARVDLLDPALLDAHAPDRHSGTPLQTA